MSEGEFKKRLFPYFNMLEGEFGTDPEELNELLDDARKEIIDNFTCLPKLQAVLLKWFGSAEKK